MAHVRSTSTACSVALATLLSSPFVLAQAAPESTTASTTPAATSGATAPVSDQAPAPTTTTTQTTVRPSEHPLLQSNGQTLSVGWRVWVHHVPAFIVGLSADVQPGWGGGTGIATGPEFVYRNGSLEVLLGLQYINYSADYGYFRGVNEPAIATEQVKSDLFSLQATSHFLYSFRFTRVFELQLGAGIGLGYVGGTLSRYQAYDRGAAGYAACNSVGNPNSAYCEGNNDHYPDSVDSQGRGTGRYQEPNWFGGGFKPVVIPFVSLPHVAFHFRPHRNFDIRIDGGFSVIGFYGGGALHYVF